MVPRCSPGNSNEMKGSPVRNGGSQLYFHWELFFQQLFPGKPGWTYFIARNSTEPFFMATIFR
jgi:hypothetical protein